MQNCGRLVVTIIVLNVVELGYSKFFLLEMSVCAGAKQSCISLEPVKDESQNNHCSMER